MSETFKRQIRFAVTGAAGFIGARLAAQLIEELPLNPAEVLLVDHVTEFDRRACVLAHPELKWAPKISSSGFLEDLEAGCFPNLSQVFHMGACSRTDETRWDYLKAVNLEYSQRIWTQAFQRGFALYYASSAATYGNGERGYSDTLSPDELRPLNLYGQSKNDFDRWALREARNGRQPIKWAGFKFFNVYGPFEFHKGSQASVLMHAFKQIQSTGRLKLFRSHNPKYPDGGQMRDFIFIDDCTRTVLEFARAERKSDIYNLGRGRAQTFHDLAVACAEALGTELVIDWVDTPENLRAQYQYFTQATTDKLQQQGIDPSRFLDLTRGAVRYLQEWRSLEKKGISLS